MNVGSKKFWRVSDGRKTLADTVQNVVGRILIDKTYFKNSVSVRNISAATSSTAGVSDKMSSYICYDCALYMNINGEKRDVKANYYNLLQQQRDSKLLRVFKFLFLTWRGNGTIVVLLVILLFWLHYCLIILIFDWQIICVYKTLTVHVYTTAHTIFQLIAVTLRLLPKFLVHPYYRGNLCGGAATPPPPTSTSTLPPPPDIWKIWPPVAIILNNLRYCLANSKRDLY